MARKPVSPKLRFEVLARDKFTCSYCGRKAPVVVLVVDHVKPVAHGGRNSADNLITACEPCNQGKGSRIGIVHPKRDPGLDALIEYNAAASRAEAIIIEFGVPAELVWYAVTDFPALSDADVVRLVTGPIISKHFNQLKAEALEVRAVFLRFSMRLEGWLRGILAKDGS